MTAWDADREESLRRREDALDAVKLIGYGVIIAILVAIVRQIAETVFG